MSSEPSNSNHRRIRVAVLFGGESDEHDVSLRSAQTVIGALDPERYEVVEIGISRDGDWLVEPGALGALTSVSPLFQIGTGEEASGTASLLPAARQNAGVFASSAEERIDVVFPVLHGPRGEDGTVQGMLELLGLPYVGSGVLGSAVAMDKIVTKMLLEQSGIAQVKWMLVNRHEFEREPERIMAEIGDRIGFPCFTKPANMGSSVGVIKAHGPDELQDALAEGCRYDRRVIVEQGIDARELEISVLGNDHPIASVAGEVVSNREFYDYQAKYVDDKSEFFIPADVSPQTMAEIRDVACAAFRALDLAGLARVDFFLERGTGKVFLNEINTIPGFTSISMYPMLWEASGVPLTELVDRLIELALERHSERRR